MGRILVRKAEAAVPAGSPLQPQLMLGGQGGSGMFLTPEKPISPHEAGMQAAMSSMGGRSYSPQQAEAITGRASRAAQMAGKYGGIAAMLGSGLKNIYDSSIQGQAPSLTGMATGAYGAQQFVRPLATRAGAQMGANVGVRRAGTPQGEMADYTQGAMPQGQQAFRMRDSFDPTQFDIAPPTPAPTPVPAPALTAENSRQTGLGEFNPGMSGGLQSSSAFNTATDAAMNPAMEQMKEQQKDAKEKKEEMDQKQLESLQENLKEKRDEQSMGA